MSSEKGHLFVISGPSGTGKSTLIERFLKEDRASRFSVSFTTREKRPFEVDGKNYRFVKREDFQKMIDEDGFLEWESVHDYFYGTPKAEVLQPLSEGIDVVLDVDVKGALAVKSKCPDAVLIFVDTPSVGELIRRLSSRGEQEIEKRMRRVTEEVAQKALFTYVIINDTINRSYQELKSIITDVRRQEDGKNNC
jgi:guanylate kinase